MNKNLARDLAKAVPIQDEIARRGIKLTGRGADRCGPCQVCGGTDRFSINTRKQLLNCRGCGRGGDVIAMVQHLDQCGFQTAIQTLVGNETNRPIMPVRPVQAVVPVDDNMARALRLWDDASPIHGTPAEKYLVEQREGLEPPEGDDVLRFHGCCPFGDTTYPCLLGLWRDIRTNAPKAIIRTALGPGGMKIKRLSLGPTGGCAIKLDPDENVEYGLIIGEGLETCLRARQLGFKPCWSVGSAGAIRSFPVLNGIETLTIMVDHDEQDKNGRRAGQEAALACARRWHGAGKEVHRHIPRRSGTDFADIITKEKNK